MTTFLITAVVAACVACGSPSGQRTALSAQTATTQLPTGTLDELLVASAEMRRLWSVLACVLWLATAAPAQQRPSTDPVDLLVRRLEQVLTSVDRAAFPTLFAPTVSEDAVTTARSAPAEIPDRVVAVTRPERNHRCFPT